MDQFFFFKIHKEGIHLSLELTLSTSTFTSFTTKSLKWHHQLYHLKNRPIINIQNKDMVIQLPKLQSKHIPLCEGYIFNKHHGIPYPIYNYKKSQYFLLEKLDPPCGLFAFYPI
jgi:hypothetical protein